MNTELGTAAFLLVFHLIGGSVLGSAVRQWLHGQFACNSLFLALWGALFGLVPLLLGLTEFAARGDLVIPAIEVGAFVGAMLIVALMPDWFLQSFDRERIGPVAFGGLFFLIGVGILILLVGQEPVIALVFFAAFGGSGLLVMASGLRAMLKS